MVVNVTYYKVYLYFQTDPVMLGSMGEYRSLPLYVDFVRGCIDVHTLDLMYTSSMATTHFTRSMGFHIEYIIM